MTHKPNQKPLRYPSGLDAALCVRCGHPHDRPVTTCAECAKKAKEKA